jgi:hypothetical protein
MKKYIVKFAVGLMLVMSSASAAFAGNEDPVTPVKFIGFKDNQPVYKLSMSNPAGTSLVVVIKDQNGIVLHEEVLNGKDIDRNYIINTTTIETESISFEISSRNMPTVTSIRIR